MYLATFGVYLVAVFSALIQFSFACGGHSDHTLGVVSLLNVTVRSEGGNDTGKALPNGLAYIWVNNKNYAPQTKGYNVAVFDALSGRFLTSSAFDCMGSQAECAKLGQYLDGLPQDVIVLLAIQDSAMDSGRVLPTSKLTVVGVQNAGSVALQTSHAVIGYKGQKSMAWKQDVFQEKSAGPAEISTSIPISYSYVPQDSTTCTPFNIASQKYGGSCLNQSSLSGAPNGCQYVLDGTTTVGWESAVNGGVNSFIKIGFHTTFTINKLRIMQRTASGQQIQEISLEFSDCSSESIKLAGNTSDFEEFTFLSRRTSWVMLTVKEVYGGSGGIGIQEIEFYNEMCKQKTICDAVLLSNNSQSDRYHLHTTKFPMMIDAKDKVHVLLTSDSRDNSPRYKMTIGSDGYILSKSKGNQNEKLMESNVTAPLLKENETRLFWIDIEKDRVVFGSGEKIYLFWRDAEPIKVKYAFFSTTTSSATFQICARVDQCYRDASYYWPLDKPTISVQDMNGGETPGTIHGPWTTQKAPTKLGIAPLALSLAGSNTWVDLGDFKERCISSPSKCPNGISVSFEARASGNGTGYILSSGGQSSKGFAIFYIDTTMHFILRDGQKFWQVHGSYQKYTWQTFAMSWSQENGLTAVIVGHTASVLRDTTGVIVTPSADSGTSFTIGRPNSKSGDYAECVIRDVAVWEDEITEEKMSKLHGCNDPQTCPQVWKYFDGSCYKVVSESLAFTAARNSCVTQGADLVKISSSSENTFVGDEASGVAWIGLKKAPDNFYHWTDGLKSSFSNWVAGVRTDDCVVMDTNGTWQSSPCSTTPSKYICEQVRPHYLGCYEESAISPNFAFNPGGYKPSSMTPGLCMHACGTSYFTYAALKAGSLCLCSNSTVPANERSSDMCLVTCFGAGNLKCGGDSHVSVYKSVQAWPQSLTLSLLNTPVPTLTGVNLSLTPLLPADYVPEYYTITVGDGTVYHTTQPYATLAFLQPGNFTIQVRVTMKHSDTGYRSTVESSMTVSAVSNVTDLVFFCPKAGSVNFTYSCLLTFSEGANVESTIQFKDGVDNTVSVPDAEIMTAGIPFADSGSQITSDGLYLLAGMEITNKGEAIALEMDVERGGQVDFKLYRPKCVDTRQRYCRTNKLCVSNVNNATMCPASKAQTCDDDKMFSFTEGQCAMQNKSCSENKTTSYGNFDYKHISSYMVYTTSGHKLILIESKSQRFKLEEGDVIGVRFPANGPAAALKTSLSSSSFLYSSSVLNATGTQTLRGNRLPSTAESPTKVLHAPAFAIRYSAVSSTRFEYLYSKSGHETVSFSVGNSRGKVSFTQQIVLQEAITGLELHLPSALPSAEIVNITTAMVSGTNVTYIWVFGDGENATTLTPWVTHLYKATGIKTINVMAVNKVSLSSIWCSIVIQERIAGMRFREDTLLPIENGTTAKIGWLLRNGSHVDLNITITGGESRATNLTDAKAPGATLFAIYSTNLTVPGQYLVTITATNKLNTVIIKGNLSVQLAVSGVLMSHPGTVKTNQTFNFTISPHQGDEMARYTLQTMDGRTTNTTQRLISYVYHKVGRYRVALITSNDVSSVAAHCEEVIVQDVIKGLQFTSSVYYVGVMQPARLRWKLTQGTELAIYVNYGDGVAKLFNHSITVADVFVAISIHNYSQPGEYLVNITANNTVDSQWINTTVYVETPISGAKLAVAGHGSLQKAEGGSCTGDLYVAVNDSVTATATVLNGTNVNVVFDFGDGSETRRYLSRKFPENGTTSNHSYSTEGEYNITVVLFNRNLPNVSQTCRVIVQYPVSVVKLTSDSPQPSSPGDVKFDVSFPGYFPSAPRYTYQFGDHSLCPIEHNNNITHRYPGKGVYTATVNVSNEVSTGSASIEVKIQDKVEGVNISSYLTRYINDCPKEKFTPQEGVFPLEYNISFNASITNGTNVTYTWSFEDGVPPEIKGVSCLRNFSSTGKHTITLTARNEVSNITVTRSITVDESILKPSLTNDGPAEMTKPLNFTLNMEKKGNNSCFKIDLVDGDPIYYKTGTPSKPCSEPSSKASFLNQVPTNFTHIYSEARDYHVTLTAKNRVSCVMIRNEKSKAAIVKGECRFPIITAPGIGDSSEKPTKKKRSEKIIIKTVNELKCYNYTTEYGWNISKLHPDQQQIKTDRSDLIILPRLLDYGDYIFRFLIKMVAEPGVFTEKKFYIEITQSDLVSTIDGGTERTVGSEELLVLNAEKSHDPDSMEPGDLLDIKTCGCKLAWFCKQDGDENYELPTNFSNLPPMPTPPPPKNITGNNTAYVSLGGCFDYGPGQLNFTNLTKITLNTSSMISGKTYVIRVLMEKGDRRTHTDQTITVKPGSPPTMGIECEHCEGKVNPSSKLALIGTGTSSGGRRITFRWEMKECRSPDNKDDCTNVSQAVFKGYRSTPLDSSNLVIKPLKLKGGWGYKFTVFGKSGGAEGSSTRQVSVNEPPEIGKCTATPPDGKPMEPMFKLVCDGFKDNDKPLSYEFFYSTNLKNPQVTLGGGLEASRSKVTLPSGMDEHKNQLKLYVKVSDSLGASTRAVPFNSNITVEKITISVAKLQKNAEKQLASFVGTGNTRELASFVITVAATLNDQSSSTGGKSEDKEKSKELREALVNAVVNSAKVSKDTSLSDLTQVAETVDLVTSNPNQNSDKVVEQLSNFCDDAGNAILAQATGNNRAPSENIEEASGAVFKSAVNVFKTVSQESDEQSSEKSTATNKKVLGTVNKLSEALLASKLPGEEKTTLNTSDLSLGVSRENAADIGNKPIEIDGGKVDIPNNTTFGNGTVDLEIMLSTINLNTGGKGLVNNSKFMSFTVYDSNANNSREEYSVKGLEKGKEIRIMVPRANSDIDQRVAGGKLHSDKFTVHEFGIHDNKSAVTIEVTTTLPIDVVLYLKIGSEPKPSQGVYDFNVTLSPVELRQGSANSSNSTSAETYEWFLSNDDLNKTAAGTYFAKVRYQKPMNYSLTEEEVEYNFSVYTSLCSYFDEKNNRWTTEGVKVGPKTSRRSTECLTNHLTTFASDFFVPPNKINFNELSVEKLLQSPHALIAVCIVLGLYLLCLIPARRSDKNDALKAGVTPLPDNDSRDTYCYEIQVHTGFVRGAGSSAEVSIVLTGALGDSEPRVLKDPKRKILKTGAVDAFLLTVPQSLGNLNQIRVWHNNGGRYPSWNLLRVMIQDIQTDQRWWFVCDDWLAVDEGDGKIERNLYPASKKDLTKFNVLFTSEVRKNLTDGHIWFSVVTRPSRSTFTRVQRLTCCLSILLCTMVANAMFYRVGENETPKNAIKIMGFSFSIRQVSIGILSSLVVFPANLIIVTIFRKAKPKENRYTVKTDNEVIDNVDIETGEERKKAPPQKGLPHWFIYVAYVIAFLAVTTSGSFVIMYGMEFGPEKSAQWLSSMTISFLQDVLLTQPIKVFLLATMFALLIKDPKKAEENSYADVNALANDEEWLHKNTEDLDPEMQKTLKMLINDKPPDEAKLEIARQLRMKEKQMKSIIREIAWYVIFLLVLLTISYGNRDLMTSQVTRYMQSTFEKAAYSGNLTYKKVHEIGDYWKWMNETFIPSLTPGTYYDGVTPYEKGFLADTPNAWLLGVARLRQLRIKKDTCEYKRAFEHIITECNDFYSMEDEDQGAYLPGWKGIPLVPRQNLSVTPAPTPSETPRVKGPWVFQSGEDLKTFPYWGYKATYSAGGYVQTFPKDANESLKITGNLSASGWLDRYTRAIFSEFAIYNANANLFCVVTLLFEQLPTGSLTPYPSILTLRLFRYVGGEMYFVLTCELVYILFCAFFVVREIRQFVKKGREHLKNPWSVLEIFVTLLSLCAVGLYFARLKFTKDALKDMDSDSAGFVSFHYTAFLDEWLKCIMGLIVFFSFLKLFRLLRFNRRMSLLQQVLKRCFSSLLSFMFMFALAFLAFALLACLVFGQAMEGFGTLFRSCASLMDTLLGKFTLKEMMGANRIIGPIFFYTYTVSMVFVLINMFLSIINDAFAEVRSDVEKQSNEFEIVDFMVHRLKENIGKSIGHAIHPVYKEPKSELEVNFDKIADNADNAMHFMRNIAFEDMRKTRWFQMDNCTDKKKNLMRLLMEVDWDYYEDELCDSIPVFERFLNQYSNDELENALHYYREKRMVEDMVYNKVTGTGEDDDSSAGSNSESDDSNDESNGSVSDDDRSSNDENGPETEDGTRLLTPTLGASRRPSSSNSHRGSVMLGVAESEPKRIRSPSLLVTDLEPTTAAEMNQQALKRESVSIDPHTVVSENELVQILQEVRRDVESRCATDAEIDSIIGDSLSPDGMNPLKFDSEPENIGSKKNNVKKRRKKKGDEKEIRKDAWGTTTDDKAEDNAPAGEPAEDKTEKKKKKKKEKKAKKQAKRERILSDSCTGDEEGDEEVAKPKKKAKDKAAIEGEEEVEPKKKKNKVPAADGTTEENIEVETNEGEGKKNKKKTKKQQEETGEPTQELSDAPQAEAKKKKKQEETSEATQELNDVPQAEKKKKKKKKADKKPALDEDDGHSSVKSDDTKNEGKTKKKKKKEKTTEEEVKEESEC